MEKEMFNNLVIHGFDVEFNHKGLLYSVTTGQINGQSYFFLANEKKWNVKFKNIKELDDYVLDDMTIVQIISKIPEEEIYY